MCYYIIYCIFPFKNPDGYATNGIYKQTNKEIKSYSNVQQVYSDYCAKVKDIVSINSKCKIVVVPALPTKSAELNRKVLDFDDLLINNLPQMCRNVTRVRGVSGFVDGRTGLLRESLSKKPDPAGT